MVPVFMRHYCTTVAVQAAQVNDTAIAEEMQAPLLHHSCTATVVIAVQAAQASLLHHCCSTSGEVLAFLQNI
jgi:hypothetical protein